MSITLLKSGVYAPMKDVVTEVNEQLNVRDGMGVWGFNGVGRTRQSW